MTAIALNAMIIEGSRLSGIGHYTVQLATWFARIGSEYGVRRVVVFCRPDAAHHLSAVLGIEIVTVPTRGGRVARVLAEQIRLPRLLRRERIDAVLNPSFTGPVRGSPAVTTVHDLYFRVVPELLPRAQRLFLSAMVPFCCRRSLHVVTTSASTMRDLVRHYPDLAGRITVVPMANRLSAPLSLPDAPRGSTMRPFVLMVAAVTGNKNPEPLVAAITALRQRYPDLMLVHVGSDPDRRLAAAVEQHCAGEWIESRTGISDAELAELYRQCLCVAIPSLYEGFGLPLLEAQAAGAPVVSSDRSSLPEVGGEGALYFDPTDPVRIAAEIETLIASPERREALRLAGFANQARFSWERTARAMLDLMLDRPGTAKTA
jgi:glycosyltransferase involved in cell wall biosynthesis